MLNADQILHQAGFRYAELKGYTGREDLPSDQIRALTETLCTFLNKELDKINGMIYQVVRNSWR